MSSLASSSSSELSSLASSSSSEPSSLASSSSSEPLQSISMSSLASSSSSEPILTFEYDVLLTFFNGLGEDRPRTFLENSLREAGLKTLVADIVNDSTWQMIESCRIVMVLITPELVRSQIERLVNILSRPKTVLPFFYGVNENQVRAQLASLHFLQSSDERIFDWDWELRSHPVCSLLFGFTLSDDFGDQEAVNDFIEKSTSYSQVGVQLRVKDMLLKLSWIPNFRRSTIIVPIFGVGGIGKTTIVRALYDTIGCHFECRSFLANIKDVWENSDGQSRLQKQLSDIQMNCTREGPYRRALIVLDDVNQGSQLTALCGNKELFGKGSLIFVTTTNKGLINGFAGIYKVEKLDDSESFELFSWHAFKNFGPTNDFVNLSRKVITVCNGLPLVLEVIGSLLHNKVKSEWEKILNELEIVPRSQVKHMLKISMNFLADSEKKLFCDIARFYVGKRKSDVMHFFKGSRFPIEKGMQVLIEHSLVKVVNDKIHVHDLLQQIGREVTTDKQKFTYIHDVFLSFRGEDTRKSFATDLYTALKEAGIKVFMDEEGIAKGEQISSSLLQAIESSRISIIIFSQNYAGSSWCLKELEKIMKCYRETYQEVFPIFYDVQPSEVRKQQNAFGTAWKMLITTFPISRGGKEANNLKEALIEAANLSGWDKQNYRTDVELLDDIVKTITMRLDNKYKFVAHHPVGLESRVHDIIQLLSSESNEIIIIGIWGMGGMGKTTMAKAIYNEMGQSFMGKSFLENIREEWEKDNGQVCLQEKLLSSILLGKRMIKQRNAGMRKSLIKEILCQQRVFLVLDDVSNEDQLKVLCGSREWFGQGSKIIITTRDKRLLQILQVDEIFSVRGMDDNESIELFSWHAFKQALPKKCFVELSKRVASYCQGLPLALEILGSYLFDREIPYWESALNRLEQIPNGDIHKILKISYDGLSDKIEQELFLDICCFFIGKDRSYATQILDGCGLHAEIGITHLIERSLVKVAKFGNKNILDMHDLLRDMGRKIIRDQSPEEPEERTRLWLNDDVLNVLENNIGTIAIKGLSLTMPRNNSVTLSTNAFEKIKKLRLLNFNHVQLNGDYAYLSKELRWLCWHGLLLENLPTNFNLEKIVAIDLKWSNLTKVWEKSQVLKLLKILNLSHSHCLTETPDFSKLPYLEKLILKDCPRLSMINSSIGKLGHLILLNLKNCNGLEHLPRSIYDLKSLRTLNLFGCSKIERLDEDIEKMESLMILEASQTAITQAPISLVRMKNIKYVSLCGYEGLSSDVFQSLILSWMPPTNPPRSLFQAYGIMPSIVKCLSHPLFPKSRDKLIQITRTSQPLCEKTPVLTKKKKKTPALIDFHEEVHKEWSETFMSSIIIPIGEFNQVTDTLLKSILQRCMESGFGLNSLPGDNNPHWRNFKGEGSSIFFEIPQIMGKSLKGLIVCIIYLSSQDNMTFVYPIGVIVSNHTKATIKLYLKDAITDSNDEDNWQDMISNLDPGNKVQLIVTFVRELIVKNTLVYLVYDDVSNRIMS